MGHFADRNGQGLEGSFYLKTNGDYPFSLENGANYFGQKNDFVYVYLLVLGFILNMLILEYAGK